MCDFKPGDEVVSVRRPDLARQGFHALATTIKEGEVHTVEWVGTHPSGLSAVRLVGVKQSSPRSIGFDSRCFRKVQRRKTDLSIESFLTIKPGFEEPRRPKAPAKKERA